MTFKRDNKREAFAAFVREHQASLRSFLRVIGVQSDSVDDLAQETFMVAYRELDRFDTNEDFGKWLRGIARNLTRNELRKNARRSRIMNEELTQHLLAEAEADQSEARFEDADLCALRDCLETNLLVFMLRAHLLRVCIRCIHHIIKTLLALNPRS